MDSASSLHLSKEHPEPEHPDPPREPAEPIDGLRAEFTALREEVRQSKREFDELQLQAAKARQPWYRDPTKMVSVAAFLLSLISAVMGGYRRHQEDIHNARTELTDVIQRLSAIQREQTRMPEERGEEVSASFTYELMLLTHHAEDVMRRIPGHVTTLEYLLVANSLRDMNDFRRARELYGRAREVAKTYEEEARALRSQALQAFEENDEEAGRRLFQESIDIGHSKYAGELAANVQFSEMGAYIRWSQAELYYAHNCEEARKRVQAGYALLQQSTDFIPNREGFRAEFDTLLKQVANCEAAESME
jgi:tetratricopeptide (TPR) repeat protein